MNKRFIAGAICPQCQLIDKIVVYQQDDTHYCECVRCGYKQQQPTGSTAAEPVKNPASQEKVIRIVKPPKKA